MTDSLKTFFDTLPTNHWSSLIVAILSLIFIVYSIYFFFSKEGKDERGKEIISQASFISFIVTLVLLFIVGNFLFEVATHNVVAYSWILNFVTLLISGTEAIGIFILKKTK